LPLKEGGANMIVRPDWPAGRITVSNGPWGRKEEGFRGTPGVIGKLGASSGKWEPRTKGFSLGRLNGRAP